MEIGESISGAVFSDDRRYRYSLWRRWEKESGDNLLFIGLNPSTASDIKDDPTISRLISFAKSWGFGGLFCGNLFSLVSSNPAKLFYEDAVEVQGGPNDQTIKRMREFSTLVLVGWGTWGIHAGDRPAAVINLVGGHVFCLKVTRKGEPNHPLYMPADSKLMLYHRKSTIKEFC